MAGAGPIILFDKSVLQSLSIDESVWFDTFYLPSITPLFFVEVLADLEKEVQKGLTPEQVVGNLADKSPNGGGVNVHHHRLSVAELFGNKVEMRHFPVIEGGRTVRTSDGKRGVVFDRSPEQAALSRWQNRQFLETERQFAKEWRQAITRIDLEQLFEQGREIIRSTRRPKDLGEAKQLAASLLAKPAARYVATYLQSLNPESLSHDAFRRWDAHGKSPITTYAPYTAHLLLVDLFFTIALGADLIGRERPTNRIDMSYLYYLPFCMVFTSRDRLHERTAPLFFDEGQLFLRGDDLKADLRKLDEHYAQLPNEIKQRGVMSFAHYPPTEGDFLISKLWDELMRPDWRELASQPKESRSKEEDAKIIAEIDQVTNAPSANKDYSHDEIEAMVIQRSIPVQRGKWRMVPPEAEK
jgi:hypothetical protein